MVAGGIRDRRCDHVVSARKYSREAGPRTDLPVFVGGPDEGCAEVAVFDIGSRSLEGDARSRNKTGTACGTLNRHCRREVLRRRRGFAECRRRPNDPFTLSIESVLFGW